MLNIEHVAQRNFSPARTTAADGYREAVADSGEAPIYAGVVNRAPFLDRLFERGVVRLRRELHLASVRTCRAARPAVSRALEGAALVTVMQAPPLYHTTGEVLGRHLDAWARAHGALPRVLRRRSGEGAGHRHQDRLTDALIDRAASTA